MKGILVKNIILGLCLALTGSAFGQTHNATLNGAVNQSLTITGSLSGVGTGSTQTAGSGGVTANLCLITDTSSPAKYIINPTASTGGAECQGVSTTTVAANATFTLLDAVQTWTMVADGAISAGNFVSISGSVAGDVADTSVSASSGFPTGTNFVSTTLKIVGVALTSTTGAAQTLTVRPAGIGQRGGKVDTTYGNVIPSTGNGVLMINGGATSIGTIQTVASGTTIAPTAPMYEVILTGTTAVATVTLPSGFTSGCFDEYNAGAIATTTAGNINAIYTLTAGSQHRWCYGMVTSKWTVQ